jgi:hypothetical protein
MSRVDQVGRPLWFDIRDYAPDHVKNPNRLGKELISDRSGSAEQYRHINFMVHLLWGIPYYAVDADENFDPDTTTVHGRVDFLAKAMLVNMGKTVSNPQPPGIPGPPQGAEWPSQLGEAPEIMEPMLRFILTLPAVTAGATVKQLFNYDSRDQDPRTERFAVVRECIDMIDALDARGYELCLPFTTIQGRNRLDPPIPWDLNDRNARRLVDATWMERHTSRLKYGDDHEGGRYLTMKDMFVGPKAQFHAGTPSPPDHPENEPPVDPSAIQAIQWLRRNGVFRARRPDPNLAGGSPIGGLADYGIKSGGQGNNYKCYTGEGCKKENGFYCSYDSQGECSAMGG